MKKHNISLISILLVTLFIGTLMTSCDSSKTTPVSTSSSSDGATLMQERCSVCHPTDRITSAHKTADQWTTTVERMISKGAQLNPQEQQMLNDFLAANFK